MIENSNALTTLYTHSSNLIHAASAACMSAIEHEIGFLAFMIVASVTNYTNFVVGNHIKFQFCRRFWFLLSKRDLFKFWKVITYFSSLKLNSAGSSLRFRFLGRCFVSSILSSSKAIKNGSWSKFIIWIFITFLLIENQLALYNNE